MAEVQQSSGGDGKKGHQKKMAIRVDFTPMVDMNMLLITFFMLCTTMIKSQTLTIALPTNEKVQNEENMSQASADDAVTIILDAKKKPGPVAGTLVVDSVNGNVVNEVYYYFGKPGGDNGMFGAGGAILSENNNLQKSEFLTDEVNSVGDRSARGIRQIIQDRNKDVLKEIAEIKKKLADGEFGSLETKADREAAMEKYNEAASAIRKNENLKKPVIIIKSTPEASYRGLVDVLDEMQINSISKYQIDNLTDADLVMLDDYRKHHQE
ncbi:MAG: biopolymer transporter ExbD [Muribaculaceae bacterium]|nr:biopolymer transporter ExbD [Muribaculaceae bacterium]